MRGTVTTYLASLEDLMLKVMGASSAALSSAMMCFGRKGKERG